VTPISVIFFTAGILFAAAALLVLYRIVVGPSILDRMIASDVLLTTLILVVGAEMVYNGHTRTIPVMLVLASTAVFATVAVARYVSKQDKLAPAVFTANDPTANDLTADNPTANDPTANDPTGNDPTSSDPTSSDPTTNDPQTVTEAVTEKDV
jgi:multicomponent Na+:H+ antiporter subunit F